MLAFSSISTTNMELEFSSHCSKVDINKQQRKRNSSPGIRIVGNRIYDSTNGITCHQCRQKTRDFVASCKNPRDGKPCVIKFCHKCLLNRYGEKAQEVELSSDWKCPKCRSICNCSCCMKKRGQQPTGQLAHTAKASGFKSVSEMLGARASENLELNKDNNDAVLPSKKEEATLEKEQKLNGVDSLNSNKNLTSKAVSSMKPIASEKELIVDLSGEPEKENSLGGNSDKKVESLKIQKTSPKKSKKTKREGLKEISNGNSVDNACKSKSSKRPKIRQSEAPQKDAKRKANDGIKVCNQVSEKDSEKGKNHDILRAKMDDPEACVANDFCVIPIQKGVKECKNIVVSVDGNNDTVHAAIDGPAARDVNGFFSDPISLAPKNYFLNTDQYYVNQETHQTIWNGTVAVNDGDNAGVQFQTGTSKSQCIVNSEREKIEEEIPLPLGTELTELLDIEIPPDDVGNALQFLEFCRAFGKALDLKKGEAEAILRELTRKQSLRRGQNTLVVQFQIRVLTLILTDSGNESPSLTSTNGNNSWLKALEDLFTESVLVIKEFPLDWLQEGISGYYDLDLSKKLSLLNFICDEALNTDKLRSYIEDQNSKYAEEKKEAKSKVAAAKEKEKRVKQKLQGEMAKAIMANVGVAPLSMSKHDALISKIKSEAARAHTEVLQAMGTVPKRKQSSDAMRTEPEFLDSSGQVFWKLKSYNGDYAVLMQVIKIQDIDSGAIDEKWFVYGPEKQQEIDKYISSRAKRSKIWKVPPVLPNEINEANM